MAKAVPNWMTSNCVAANTEQYYFFFFFWTEPPAPGPLLHRQTGIIQINDQAIRRNGWKFDCQTSRFAWVVMPVHGTMCIMWCNYTVWPHCTSVHCGAMYRCVQITDCTLLTMPIPTCLTAYNTTIFSACPQIQITASTFWTTRWSSLKNTNIRDIITAEKYNRLQLKLKQTLRMRMAKCILISV